MCLCVVSVGGLVWERGLAGGKSLGGGVVPGVAVFVFPGGHGGDGVDGGHTGEKS